MPQNTPQNANLIGSLWMIAAMFGFAIEDALIKATFSALPVWQILVMFGLGGALVFATVAHRAGEQLFPKTVLSTPMRIRMFFEIFGRLFFTLAITLTPLSTTTVILQATPIVVVAAAAVLFGETVGWRRWLAICIGLLGVLVILQPTPASFTPMSLLAVFGMIGFAGRDLASRAAPASLSTAILGIYGFLALAIAGVVYAFFEHAAPVMPDMKNSAFIIAIIVVGAMSYASLMKAMRTGEVSAVTPFRYSRLLIGIAFGVLFFNETLDTRMLIGSALIVAAGVFLLIRGKK
ncbi:membrane protein [Amylibacter ulvae]|uniref:Membrane protein n=1 Tax=Paramylibacter ulvae TaxID=1651968 RepID=A0ABQ3D0T1_9RHOB|nr:DMT family transporter [Amylibacter ulvae]GHA47888.1 membrane protein [Amylibacter ulvae]